MSFGTFHAAKFKGRDELFVSLRGKSIFNSKGALSNSIGHKERRVRDFNRADVEILEVEVISKSELDSLRQDSRVLGRLEAAGVDNWDGYHLGWVGEFEDEDEDGL